MATTQHSEKGFYLAVISAIQGKALETERSYSMSLTFSGMSALNPSFEFFILREYNGSRDDADMPLRVPGEIPDIVSLITMRTDSALLQAELLFTG